MSKKIKIILIFIIIVVLSILLKNSKVFAAGEPYTLPKEIISSYEPKQIPIYDNLRYALFCGEHKQSHDWETLMLKREGTDDAILTYNGVYQDKMKWHEEASGQITNMVGYAFYLADQFGCLKEAYANGKSDPVYNALQDVIWTSYNDPLVGENIAIKGDDHRLSNLVDTEDLNSIDLSTKDGIASYIRLQTRNYAEVYYRILKYTSSYEGSAFTTVTADGEAPKVYVNQKTGKYTVGPYKTYINTNISNLSINSGSDISYDVVESKSAQYSYEDESENEKNFKEAKRNNCKDFYNATKYLYDILINPQNYMYPYATFDLSTAFENFNVSDYSSIEFVDKDGNKINFPNFIAGKEKEYYIRFTPANKGAITETATIHNGNKITNPNFKITYMSSFNGEWKRYYCQKVKISFSMLNSPTDYKELLKWCARKVASGVLMSYGDKDDYKEHVSQDDGTSYGDPGSSWYSEEPVEYWHDTITVNVQVAFAHHGSVDSKERNRKFNITVKFNYKQKAVCTSEVHSASEETETDYNDPIKDENGNITGYGTKGTGIYDKSTTHYYQAIDPDKWEYTGTSITPAERIETDSLNIHIKDDTERQVLIKVNSSGKGSVTPNYSTTKDYIPDAKLNMELQGTVWIDQKDQSKENTLNGVMDKDETRFRGIQVSLYEYAKSKFGNDSNLRSGGDKLVATTTTDKNGKYWFFGRKPGTTEPLMNPLKQYYVVFRYNGQLYQDTYYKSDLSAGGNHSNAKEVNAVGDKQNSSEFSRAELDARFATIHSSDSSYIGLNGENRSFAYNSSVGLNYSNYWENFVNAATFTKSEVEEPQLSDYYKEYNRQKSYEDVYNATSEAAGSQEQMAEQYIKDCMINAYTENTKGDDRKARYPSYDKFVIINIDKSTSQYKTGNYTKNPEIYPSGYTFLYTKAWDQARYVNFGLFVRQQNDLALQKDVYRATIMINGQRHIYNYNKKDAKLDENGDKIWTVNVRKDDVLYNGETVYNREVRASDYLYTADDELGNPVNYTSPKNLQVYVTYRIAVKNLGSVDTKLDEIVDYYDSDNYEFDGTLNGSEYTIKTRTDHESNDSNKNTIQSNEGVIQSYIGNTKDFVQSYVGNRKGAKINDNLKVYDSSQYGIGRNANQNETLSTSGSNYNTVYISGITDQDGNEWLTPGKMAFVYLTFKVKTDPNTMKPKLDEALYKDASGKPVYTVGKRNISEINCYETKYTKDATLPSIINDNGNKVDNKVEGKKAGIVDFNSNAGNLASEDLTDAGRIKYDKVENYKLFNQGTLKEEEDPTSKYKFVENDTDQAPNIRLVIPDNSDETREMSGYVYEDNRTNTVENSMIGDGNDNNEIKINGVTIKLIELVQNVDAEGMSFGTYNSEKEIVTHLYNDNAIFANYDNTRYYSGQGQSRVILSTTNPNSIFYTAPTNLGTGNGKYALTSLPSGNYYIEFAYGDNDQTVLTTSTENEVNKLLGTGLNAKSYNGQDYKSTIYQAGIDQSAIKQYRDIKGFTDVDNQDYYPADVTDRTKMYLYDFDVADTKKGISDAKDSYYRRQANIDYSSTLKNHNSEVLASFEKLGQVSEGEDQKTFQRGLVNELEKETYMESRTGVIDIEVERYRKGSGTNNSNDEKVYSGNDENKTTGYKIEDIDLGLQERPRSQLMLNKQATSISVVLPNGQTLFNTAQSANNLYYAQHGYHIYGTANKSTDSGNAINFNNNFANTTDLRLFKTIVSSNSRNTPELIQGYIDDELLEGAKLTVHYKFRIKNVGEVDYSDKTFYYIGTESDKDTNLVTTNPNIVIDYLTNESKYDQALQDKGVTWVAATSDDLVPSKTDSTKLSKDIVNRIYYDTLGTYNSILITQGLSRELKPTCYDAGNGSESETTLIASADMSMNSSGDNLVYNNLSEIVMTTNTVGRRMQFSIVGNQEMANQDLGNNTSSSTYTNVDLVTPTEVDADSAQKIIFMPPTGDNKNYIPMIIAVVIAMGFVIAGAIVIKRNNK